MKICFAYNAVVAIAELPYDGIRTVLNSQKLDFGKQNFSRKIDVFHFFCIDCTYNCFNSNHEWSLANCKLISGHITSQW